jgi:hypothetical protein
VDESPFQQANEWEDEHTTSTHDSLLKHKKVGALRTPGENGQADEQDEQPYDVGR